MPGIDDPIEAVKKQYREQPDPVLDLILEVAGKVDFFAGVASAIRKHFSKQAANERIAALLSALESTIRRLEADIRKVSARLESPEFVEALCAAVDQTLRTSDAAKIRRFAAILGYSSIGAVNSAVLQEASAYIRDVSQLGEADIEALQILHLIQAAIFAWHTATTDPNPFTERLGEVLTAVDRSGMTREEFYSRCSRLNGFGLAIEVQRNDSRMAPGDHCFRITSRGLRLVNMISDT